MIDDSDNSIIFDEEFIDNQDENSDTEISAMNSYVESYSNSFSYSYMNDYINKKYNKKDEYKYDYLENKYSSSFSNSDKYYENSFSYKNENRENFMELAILNIKNNKISKIQKKNTKLKYKLVLNELRTKNIKDNLYLDIIKLKFQLVLKDLILYKDNEKFKTIYKNVYKNIVLYELKKYFEKKKEIKRNYKLLLSELEKRRIYSYGIIYKKFIDSL